MTPLVLIIIKVLFVALFSNLRFAKVVSITRGINQPPPVNTCFQLGKSLNLLSPLFVLTMALDVNNQPFSIGYQSEQPPKTQSTPNTDNTSHFNKANPTTPAKV